jgi:hypothetical protein
MPRLLTLLPCERVLLGDDQTISLIIILSEVHFKIPPNNPPPKTGAVMFYRWAVMCQWEVAEEESNIEWEQQLSLRDASGLSIFENITKFQMPTPEVRIHRMISAFEMIPLLPPDMYYLSTRCRKAGDSEWIEGGTYPLRIIHEPLNLPVEQAVS